MVNLDNSILKELDLKDRWVLKKSFTLDKLININSVLMCTLLNIFDFLTEYHYVIQIGLEPIYNPSASTFKMVGITRFNSLKIFLFVHLLLCVCTYMVCRVHMVHRVGTHVEVNGQLWNLFSPSNFIWVPGMKLKCLGFHYRHLY